MEEKIIDFTMKIIGVGGAGINVVNDMIESNIVDVEYITADTDLGKLGTSNAATRVQIGKKTTKGFGTGGDYHKGYMSVKEEDEAFSSLMKGTDMLFIVGALGGGTGSGGILRLAELAKKHGVLTMAIVTKPFSFEGKTRKKNTEVSFEYISETVNSYITISNDNLMLLPNKEITFQNAFKEADKVLKNTINNVSDIILKPGTINLDFADIRSVLSNAKEVVAGFVRGKGDIKSLVVEALSSPLIETDTKATKQLIISIKHGMDFPLEKLQEFQVAIEEVFEGEVENMLLGLKAEEGLGDDIEIAILGSSN